MPRFTISSLAAGVILALVAVYFLNAMGSVSVRRAIDAGHIAPPGGPVPGAVDPANGMPALGTEKANDYPLQDSFDSSGGLDAATW